MERLLHSWGGSAGACHGMAVTHVQTASQGAVEAWRGRQGGQGPALLASARAGWEPARGRRRHGREARASAALGMRAASRHLLTQHAVALGKRLLHLQAARRSNGPAGPLGRAQAAAQHGSLQLCSAALSAQGGEQTGTRAFEH